MDFKVFLFLLAQIQKNMKKKIEKEKIKLVWLAANCVEKAREKAIAKIKEEKSKERGN